MKLRFAPDGGLCYEKTMTNMEDQPMDNTAGTLTELALKRSYFFDNGLMFECQRCGDCCTGAPGTIYVAQDEIAPIAELLGLSADGLISTYLYPFKDSYSIREDARGNCLFFNEGCAIYENRPLQCLAYPFWFSNLRSRNQWEKLKQECPGIGRGRHFTKMEIFAMARRTTHL